MLKKGEFWILLLVTAGALVLALTNMALYAQNRQAQADVNARGQYIQQTAQLETLYREMAKALADLSVRNNDSQIKEMLAKQGITMSTSVVPSGAPTPAPAPEAKKGGK